jgi:hypothetical protein
MVNTQAATRPLEKRAIDLDYSEVIQRAGGIDLNRLWVCHPMDPGLLGGLQHTAHEIWLHRSEYKLCSTSSNQHDPFRGGHIVDQP